MYSTTDPIDVGNDKQLFLDDLFFASARGVELTVNPPVDGGTAIHADRPWESAHACNWCVVVPDEERIRIMYCGPGVVRDGNRLYHYHSYNPIWHGHGRPGRYETIPPSEYSGSVRRAELRLDGYVSADAANLKGGFVTPPLVHAGRRLELNVDTSASGWLQVELLNVHVRPIHGYRLEEYALQECDRVIANSTARTVTWNGNADVSPLADWPVRMHIRMRNAKLYAFQFK